MPGRDTRVAQKAWSLTPDSLADFPGAALLLQRGIAPLPANAAGAALLAEIDDEARAAFAALAVEALAAGCARAVVDGAPAGRDVLLLPLADGAGVLALVRDGQQ